MRLRLLTVGLGAVLIHCGARSTQGGQPSPAGTGGEAGQASSDGGRGDGGEGDPMCPREPLVACEPPTSGEVIVDIRPPCAVVFDGSLARCVLTTRLPDEERNKRCVNEAFWRQQQRLFATQAECRARCNVEGESDPDCEEIP